MDGFITFVGTTWPRVMSDADALKRCIGCPSMRIGKKVAGLCKASGDKPIQAVVRCARERGEEGELN